MGQNTSISIGHAYPGTESRQDAPGSRSLGRWLAGLQGLFAVAAILGLVAAPPATGRMLLVPVDAQGRDGLARIAIDAGARLVDRGPFGGSLVVFGDRGPLMAALLPRHVLVLRAEVGGCGDEGQRR
jgi:hypothetical protein